MNRFAAGLAGVLAALVLLYWGYGVLKKRELAEAVIALVADTSAELREALALEAVSSLAGTPEAISRVERYSRSTDRRLATLDTLETWRDRPLAEGAKSYMQAARQLLGNQVASHRSRAYFMESTATLREHMAGASRRTEGWIGEALRQKRQVDRHYVEYRYTVENFRRLLDAWPDARLELADRLGPGLLVEPSLASEARTRVIEAGKRAAAEMEKARRLAGPR